MWVRVFTTVGEHLHASRCVKLFIDATVPIGVANFGMIVKIVAK